MLRNWFAAGLLLLGGCVSRPVLLEPAAPPAQPIEVQIIALNDFHGNLERPTEPIRVAIGQEQSATISAGGAAELATTVQHLRETHANSITVSAGDLIGASPLVSAYFLDEPTIQAMNAIGLQLNAVGNHEFDKGSAELERMQKGGCEKYTTRVPCRLEPFKGASFTFLAANVHRADGTTIFPGSALRQFGPVKIGFIGMTLKETKTLVTPAGVAGLSFDDETVSANALVPSLKAAGADTIVLLIHQGGKLPATYRERGCDGLQGPILDILDKLDPSIAVVVSGHTHHAYNCALDRAGSNRLLTSAGKYGYFVTDIRLTFDPSTHALIAKAAANVPVARQAGDPGVAAIVRRYADAAAPAAARVVGKVRGSLPKSGEDGESPMANLIADAQLFATRSRDRGNADIGLVNATGVRVGLTPAKDGSVTYGQIFSVQPFGNNLVVRPLTGEQLKAVLEQQFKVENGETRVGSLLVPSAGFTFAYDLSKPAGQRITSMRLNGRRIDPARTYRITVNNFLASGGDGFSVFATVPEAFDAGLDLDALEAWLATNPPAPPVGRTRNLTPR